MTQKGSKCSKKVPNDPKKAQKYPNYNFGSFGFLVCDKIELYLPPFALQFILKEKHPLFTKRKSH